MQIVLSDKKEARAMAKAAAVLAEQHVHILFARAAPTGFYHSMWNVICERTSAKHAFAERREELSRLRARIQPGGKQHSAISWEELEFASPAVMSKLRNAVGEDLAGHFHVLRETSNKLREDVGIEAARFIDEMKHALLDADRELSKGKAFLHRKIGPKEQHFWDFPKARVDELIGEFQGREWPTYYAKTNRIWDNPARYDNPVVTGDGMPWVAQAWLFGYGVERPIAFRYDAASNVLAVDPAGETEFRDTLIDQYKLSLPTRTVVAFNPEERFVRIGFGSIRPNEKRIAIQVKYKTRASEKGKPFGHGPYGLLAAVLNELSYKGIKPVHASTVVTDRNERMEVGKINLTGVVSIQPGTSPGSEALHNFLGHIRSTLQHLRVASDTEEVAGVTEVVAKDTTVTEQSIDQLFVSIRLDLLDDRSSLEEGIKQAARAFGFEAVVVKDPYGAIPDAVRKAMKASMAVLQVIPLLKRRDGTFEQVHEAQLDWILFENGVAEGLGLPIVMCVDTVNGATLDEWKKRLQPRAGWMLQQFNRSDETRKIVEDIRTAIGKLAAEIAKRATSVPAGLPSFVREAAHSNQYELPTIGDTFSRRASDESLSPADERAALKVLDDLSAQSREAATALDESSNQVDKITHRIESHLSHVDQDRHNGPL
ncbi:MAG: hypothetical protein IH987_06565 [Planctomycetes bacterium]|nr:hypothetical protein [Planctomycetota bacterium]